MHILSHRHKQPWHYTVLFTEYSFELGLRNWDIPILAYKLTLVFILSISKLTFINNFLLPNRADVFIQSHYSQTRINIQLCSSSAHVRMLYFIVAIAIPRNQRVNQSFLCSACTLNICKESARHFLKIHKRIHTV